MPEPFHVLIIGGAIGGLTLAQGLKRSHPDRPFTGVPRAHQPNRRPRLA